MTTRALAMPEYVEKLISVQLTLIGLQPETQDDVTVCPLMYEDGSTLSLVTMCIGQRGWFREKPMLVVSIVELDQNTGTVQVYSSETIAVPTDTNDVLFMIRLVAMVRASAWTVAETSNMGECVNLPGRPPA
jgi:hypothetical protein